MFQKWKEQNIPDRGNNKVQRQIYMKVYTWTHTHKYPVKYMHAVYKWLYNQCLYKSEGGHLNYKIQKMIWLTTFPNLPKMVHN